MTTKKKTESNSTEVVEAPKKKMKPRGGNNILTDAALNVQPGDNSKYVLLGMKLFNLEKVDLKQPDLVAERLNYFFTLHSEEDMKPTVSGMAMALGLDRRRLWEIKSGQYHTSKELANLPTLTTDLIKRAYEYMELLWENYMQNGKINPVSGIFLGKNNFGYQDKTEYVVTPNVHNDSDYSKEDIMKRYAVTDQLSDGSDS